MNRPRISHHTFAVAAGAETFDSESTPSAGYGRESDFQAIYDYIRPKTIWMNLSSEPMVNPFVMR